MVIMSHQVSTPTYLTIQVTIRRLWVDCAKISESAGRGFTAFIN